MKKKGIIGLVQIVLGAVITIMTVDPRAPPYTLFLPKGGLLVALPPEPLTGRAVGWLQVLGTLVILFGLLTLVIKEVE